jgi:WD40 repeat protein
VAPIALGQVRLEDYPTATLAFATRSLELADSEEARLLALEALWEGPTAFIVNETPSANASFSRGGDWLVQTHDFMSSLAIISRDGQQRFLDHPTDSGAKRVMLSFGASENFFVTEEFGNDSDWIGLWSASEGRLLASAKQVDDSDFFFSRLVGTDTGKPRALFVWGKGGLVTVEALHRDGSLERVGEFRVKEGTRICLDKRSGDWLVVEDNHVSVLRFRDSGLSDRRLLGRHEGAYRCMADPLGSLFFTLTRDGEMRRWNPSGRLAPMDFRFPASFTPFRYLPKQGFFLAGTVSENKEEISILSIGESGLELERSFDLTDSGGFWAFDPSGPWFVMRGPSPFHRLWSLAAPAGADPIVLRRGPSGYTHIPAFSPDGRWLATNDRTGLALWPLVRRYPAVIDVDYGQVPWGIGVAFALDGSFLAATGGSRVKVWSLTGPVPPAGRTAFEVGTTTSSDPAVSPDGEMFAVGSITEPPGVWIGRVGEEPLLLAGADELELGTAEVSFSPDGRFVAACDGIYDLAKGAFHVWEVSTGEKIAVLRLDGEQFRGSPGFVADGRLLTGLTKGVVAWDVETGEHEVVVDVSVRQAVSSVDGRRLLVTEEGKEGDRPQDPAGSPLFFDLDTGEVTDLTTHGSHVRYVAMDQDGTVAVTADADGVIRVGPVTGEEPHLLLGHDGSVMDLTVDPLGRWIASGGMDKTVRLWPMPDLSKPPLHTLPHDELIAKLHSLTNLRVVRDAESSTGWKLEVGPFPGWETVPTW